MISMASPHWFVRIQEEWAPMIILDYGFCGYALLVLYSPFLISKVCGILTMKFLQARDIEKALDGFTRAVQLDPENGEAWNNIACLYVFLAYIYC